MKGFKESASLILTARHMRRCVRSRPQVNVCNKFQYNYDLLCLKRQANSKFMPSKYVFPGGMIHSSDADLKWHNLYTTFGFDKNSFATLVPTVKTRPIIFNQRPNELPREISLRISAIRETFEECGILLCRKSNDSGTYSDWAQNVEIPEDEVQAWQKRVHNDATEFYSLCQNFGCYPDLWSLYEWSNWLTPTCYRSSRFDTVFYMACMQEPPETVCEASEIEDSKWDLPANFIFANAGFALAPPQQYEIARIAKFESIDNLLDFAIDRTKRGVLQTLPVKILLRNGSVYVLPGDSMYPKQANLFEEQIINRENITIEQFQEISPIKNRVEFYNCEIRKLFVQNFDNKDGHLAPMRLEDVRVIQNYQK
ncbi:acyl-coenzyme A diphosphatase NUDT19 isoform X1 [Megalopta genalis]|uniref:acyl-coenzyme A diphosphatase NUDT19 isoform X1 n=1 Tax=Megalopta genalis TaxID=115081 RepID=UPI003FD0F34E